MSATAWPDLRTWFARCGRDLPWRRSRDPWEILVAEAMLQQTQVARVLDRWPRFLHRFPTVEVGAAAPVSAVIDEWSGLGYNRRAVSLHRCARIVVDDHGGRFPVDRSVLLDLPGVGPYTARAIRVFAFELDDAVVDTNVARILARVTGRPLGRAEAQRLADAAVPAGRGWDWNQALLDIGAGHCRAGTPRCEGCPLVGCCAWHRSGHVGDDPAATTAGVSGRQSRFDGSDRQGRGRLVAALRDGPVDLDTIDEVMGWPGERDRADRVLAGLVRDGLATLDGAMVALPDG